MTRTMSGFLAVVVMAVTGACTLGHPDSERLKTGAATVCHAQHPLVLSFGEARAYDLNGNHMDSARLVQALRTILPPTPPPGRLIIVRLDAARARELRWIVPAIRELGGDAYAYDNACAAPRGVMAWWSVPR